MAKVQLSVVLPTARGDGTPVVPADISGVTLASKVTSAPPSAWSPLGPDVVPTTPSFTFDVSNVAGGSWDYRATFHDAQGGPDLEVMTTLVVGVSPLVGGSISAAVVP